MKNKYLIKLVTVLLVVCSNVGAISNVEPNVQNAISEEERRGGARNENGNANNHSNAKQKTIVDDVTGDKKTRGIHAASASHKHPHYFVPSGYDSHIAPTGHGGGGGGGGASGIGVGYNGVGTTAGYEYGSHGSGPGPSSTGGGHSHHVPTGYGSATGYGNVGVGGYGLTHGYGHSGGHIGGHIGGHSGQGGIFGGYGGGGHNGMHNVLALKGLLIPLAGIALLGAAAALSTNPVLLQLGVVNGRRRRRRSLPENYNHKYYPANPLVKPDGAY